MNNKLRDKLQLIIINIQVTPLCFETSGHSEIIMSVRQVIFIKQSDAMSDVARIRVIVVGVGRPEDLVEGGGGEGK